jgi:hypothetical protein
MKENIRSISFYDMYHENSREQNTFNSEYIYNNSIHNSFSGK